MNSAKGYLAVHDYGQGGIWLILDAPTHAEAQAAFPQLTVYETRPEWMSVADETEYRESCERIGFRWSIHSPPTGWLKQFLEHDSSRDA